MTSSDLKVAADELRVRSRAEQGLPPTVEDRDVLRRIATLTRHWSKTSRRSS